MNGKFRRLRHQLDFPILKMGVARQTTWRIIPSHRNLLKTEHLGQFIKDMTRKKQKNS